MTKQKFYVVWKGRKPGIYPDWAACKSQIDGFQGALYKSFDTQAAAETAFGSDPAESFKKEDKLGDLAANPELARVIGLPIPDSIAVDAACAGNPGKMEYRGVYAKTGKELFRKGVFPKGTINIGEFLAIVHALAFLKKNGSALPVYSDSRNAMKWVREKAVKTKLERDAETETLFQLVDRALIWLQENEYNNPVLKWKTGYWGEIPADFGRK